MTSTIMDRNLVVEKHQKTGISIPANGTASAKMDVSKAGYTPIGVVGFANGGSVSFYAYEHSISGNTLTAALKSTTSSAMTVSYSVYVLYQRT
jgi:hypothetical protein